MIILLISEDRHSEYLREILEKCPSYEIYGCPESDTLKGSALKQVAKCSKEKAKRLFGFIKGFIKTDRKFYNKSFIGFVFHIDAKEEESQIFEKNIITKFKKYLNLKEKEFQVFPCIAVQEIEAWLMAGLPEYHVSGITDKINNPKEELAKFWNMTINSKAFNQKRLEASQKFDINKAKQHSNSFAKFWANFCKN
ncbi:MAG TPA: hypothetical protein ENG63_04820 [Candidatus Desulfofervidus auxilii]|uniref:Uncharacterized protein n=1 Tax=Desulfofervidus auxilii TaxID=1621989 RepID=A0A7C0Y2Q0_DESA2|nr:hypothetical protein [Candidatus Desulfofervidus auxilii]